MANDRWFFLRTDNCAECNGVRLLTLAEMDCGGNPSVDIHQVQDMLPVIPDEAWIEVVNVHEE